MFRSLLGKPSSSGSTASRSTTGSSSKSSHHSSRHHKRDKDKDKDRDDIDDDHHHHHHHRRSSSRRSSHRKSSSRSDVRDDASPAPAPSTHSSPSTRRYHRDDVERAAPSDYGATSDRGGERRGDDQDDAMTVTSDYAPRSRSGIEDYEDNDDDYEDYDDDEQKSVSNRSGVSENDKKRRRRKHRKGESSRSSVGEERRRHRTEKEEPREKEDSRREERSHRSGARSIAEPDEYPSTRADPSNEEDDRAPSQYGNGIPPSQTFPVPHASTPGRTASARPSSSPAVGLAAEYYNDNGQSVETQPGYDPDAPPPTPYVPPIAPITMAPAPTPGEDYGDSASPAGWESDNSLEAPATSSRPPKPSTSGKISSAVAAGAAGAATYGIGSAMLGNSHSDSHSPPHPQQYPTATNGNSHPHHHSMPNAASMGALGGAAAGVGASSAFPGPPHRPHTYSGGGTQPGSLAYHRRHHGPLTRFVNFWRDPEAVAQYEEYSEIIGVCKYCFEPGSSPRDAPRKHFYRRRFSNGSNDGRSRVSKKGRYAASLSSSSSSSNGNKSKKSSKMSWIGAGLAAYVGKSILDGKLDRSSRRLSGSSSSSGSASSSGRKDLASRSDVAVSDRGRKGTDTYKASATSRRKHSDDAHSAGTRRRRSRSRSASRDSKRSGLGIAGLAGASSLGGAALASSTRGHRTRSRSPKRSSRRGYSSSSSSLVELSRSNDKPGFSGFGSFFSAPSERRQKSHSMKKHKKKNKPKKGAFSIFSPDSSSSEDPDLAFGRAYVTSPSRTKSKSRADRNIDAKLLGLGATAATLAATASSVDRKRTSDRKSSSIYDKRGRQAELPSTGHDDDWESMSDELSPSSASSVDTGLAFGSSRHSKDSVTSDPGTSKWGWGWGRKKPKSRPSEQSAPYNRQFPGYAGDSKYAPAGSLESLQSMQNVYPVPTTDPSQYDTGRNFATATEPASTTYGIPPAMITSRAEPSRIDQPQPIAPVSQNLQRQAEAMSTYGIPDVPPVPSILAADTSSGQRQADYYDVDQTRREGKRAGKGPRRTASSPTNYTTRSDGPRPRHRRSNTMRGVQFDLTQEQADKERRQLQMERDGKRRDGDRETDTYWDYDKRYAGSDDDDYYGRRRRPRSQSEVKYDPRSDDEGQDDRSASSWAGPAGAAAIAASVAAMSAKGADGRKQKHKERQDERKGPRGYDEEAEEVRTKRERSHDFDDEPQQIEQIASRHVRTPPVHESYAEFFSPPELRHGQSPRSEQSSAPSSPSIVMPGPSSGDRFNREVDVDMSPDPGSRRGTPSFPKNLPWPIPTLNLIEPSPPQSALGSVVGGDISSDEERSREVSRSAKRWPIDEEEDVPTRDSEEKASRDASPEIEAVRDEIRSASPRRSFDIDIPYVPQDKNEERTPDIEEAEVAPESEAQVEAEPVEEIEREEAPSSRMPGGFGDDFEFAATLAAGASLAGFDPSIVTDDPTYHHRDSPPGSEEDEDTGPTVVVMDQDDSQFAPRDRRGFHGFVEDSTRDSPDDFADKDVPETSASREIHVEPGDKSEEAPEEAQRYAPEPDESTHEILPSEEKADTEKPAKLSKKEKRKAKKGKKGKEHARTESETSIPESPISPEAPAEEQSSRSIPALDTEIAWDEAKTGEAMIASTDSISEDREFFDAEEARLVSTAASENDDAESVDTVIARDEPEEFEPRDDAGEGERADTASPPIVEPRSLEKEETEDRELESGNDDNEVDDSADDQPVMPGGFDQPRPSKKKSEKAKKTDDFEQQREPVDDVPTVTDLPASEEPEWEAPLISKKAKRKAKKGKRNRVQDIEEDAEKVERGDQELDQPNDVPSEGEKETTLDSHALDNVASVAPSAKADEPTGKRKSKKEKRKSGGLFGFWGSSQPEEEPEEEHVSRDAQSVTGAEEQADADITADTVDGKGDVPSAIGPDHAEQGDEGGDGTGWNDTSQRQKRKDRKKNRRSRYEEIVESGKSADGSKDNKAESDDKVEPEKSFLGERPEMPLTSDGASGRDGNVSEDSKSATAIPLDLLQSRTRSRSTSPRPCTKAVDLPPQSRSRASSPLPDQARARRISIRGDPDTNPLATPSPTAVPLHFRRPRSSHISPTAPTATEATPTSPTPQRTGHKRPKSTEFKTDREFRPLFLVERHSSSKGPAVDEPYPSLPSSKTTSRASSVESLRNASSFGEYAFDSPVDFAARRRSMGPALQISTDIPRDLDQEDLLDSQQVTPTATSFQAAGKQEESRQQQKGEKPKYEFHSPSELLPPLPPSPDVVSGSPSSTSLGENETLTQENWEVDVPREAELSAAEPSEMPKSETLEIVEEASRVPLPAEEESLSVLDQDRPRQETELEERLDHITASTDRAAAVEETRTVSDIDKSAEEMVAPVTPTIDTTEGKRFDPTSPLTTLDTATIQSEEAPANVETKEPLPPADSGYVADEFVDAMEMQQEPAPQPHVAQSSKSKKKKKKDKKKGRSVEVDVAERSEAPGDEKPESEEHETDVPVIDGGSIAQGDLSRGGNEELETVTVGPLAEESNEPFQVPPHENEMETLSPDVFSSTKFGEFPTGQGESTIDPAAQGQPGIEATDADFAPISRKKSKKGKKGKQRSNAKVTFQEEPAQERTVSTAVEATTEHETGPSSEYPDYAWTEDTVRGENEIPGTTEVVNDSETSFPPGSTETVHSEDRSAIAGVQRDEEVQEVPVVTEVLDQDVDAPSSELKPVSSENLQTSDELPVDKSETMDMPLEGLEPSTGPASGDSPAEAALEKTEEAISGDIGRERHLDIEDEPGPAESTLPDYHGKSPEMLQDQEQVVSQGAAEVTELGDTALRDDKTLEKSPKEEAADAESNEAPPDIKSEEKHPLPDEQLEAPSTKSLLDAAEEGEHLPPLRMAPNEDEPEEAWGKKKKKKGKKAKKERALTISESEPEPTNVFPSGTPPQEFRPSGEEVTTSETQDPTVHLPIDPEPELSGSDKVEAIKDSTTNVGATKIEADLAANDRPPHVVQQDTTQGDDAWTEPKPSKKQSKKDKKKKKKQGSMVWDDPAPPSEIAVEESSSIIREMDSQFEPETADHEANQAAEAASKDLGADAGMEPSREESISLGSTEEAKGDEPGPPVEVQSSEEGPNQEPRPETPVEYAQEIDVPPIEEQGVEAQTAEKDKVEEIVEQQSQVEPLVFEEGKGKKGKKGKKNKKQREAASWEEDVRSLQPEEGSASTIEPGAEPIGEADESHAGTGPAPTEELEYQPPMSAKAKKKAKKDKKQRESTSWEEDALTVQPEEESAELMEAAAESHAITGPTPTAESEFEPPMSAKAKKKAKKDKKQREATSWEEDALSVQPEEASPSTVEPGAKSIGAADELNVKSGPTPTAEFEFEPPMSAKAKKKAKKDKKQRESTASLEDEPSSLQPAEITVPADADPPTEPTEGTEDESQTRNEPDTVEDFEEPLSSKSKRKAKKDKKKQRQLDWTSETASAPDQMILDDIPERTPGAFPGDADMLTGQNDDIDNTPPGDLQDDGILKSAAQEDAKGEDDGKAFQVSKKKSKKKGKAVPKATDWTDEIPPEQVVDHNEKPPVNLTETAKEEGGPEVDDIIAPSHLPIVTEERDTTTPPMAPQGPQEEVPEIPDNEFKDEEPSIPVDEPGRSLLSADEETPVPPDFEGNVPTEVPGPESSEGVQGQREISESGGGHGFPLEFDEETGSGPIESATRNEGHREAVDDRHDSLEDAHEPDKSENPTIHEADAGVSQEGFEEGPREPALEEQTTSERAVETPMIDDNVLTTKESRRDEPEITPHVKEDHPQMTVEVPEDVWEDPKAKRKSKKKRKDSEDNMDIQQGATESDRIAAATVEHSQPSKSASKKGKKKKKGVQALSFQDETGDSPDKQGGSEQPGSGPPLEKEAESTETTKEQPDMDDEAWPSIEWGGSRSDEDNATIRELVSEGRLNTGDRDDMEAQFPDGGSASHPKSPHDIDEFDENASPLNKVRGQTVPADDGSFGPPGLGEKRAMELEPELPVQESRDVERGAIAGDDMWPVTEAKGKKGKKKGKKGKGVIEPVYQSENLETTAGTSDTKQPREVVDADYDVADSHKSEAVRSGELEPAADTPIPESRGKPDESLDFWPAERKKSKKTKKGGKAKSGLQEFSTDDGSFREAARGVVSPDAPQTPDKLPGKVQEADKKLSESQQGTHYENSPKHYELLATSGGARRGVVSDHEPRSDTKTIPRSPILSSQDPFLDQPSSLFGGPYGLADQTPGSPHSNTPLGTINEHAPIGSPSYTRHRTPADVGSPERGIKHARHDSVTAADELGSPRLRPRPSAKWDDYGTGRVKEPTKPKAASPQLERSRSVGSFHAGTSPKLRQLHSSRSGGDLRTNEVRRSIIDPDEAWQPEAIPSSSTYDPVTDKGKLPQRAMAADVLEGWGDVPSSPRSPTRPPSVRRRRSLQQVQDLESRVDQLASDNRLLTSAKTAAEKSVEESTTAQRQYERTIQTRDRVIQEKDLEIQHLKNTTDSLHREIARLTDLNEGLPKTNEGLEASRDQDPGQQTEIGQQWDVTKQELTDLREQYTQLSSGMENVLRQEIDTALAAKEAELQQLRTELQAAQETIRQLQEQIVASTRDDVIVFRDEDYFEGACQKLCQHVQQWVLRFSKFSDMRRCRLTSSIRDEKIADRFENAILDGSDVESYLADRVRRRDVFMSVVMTMMWEFIFTRYLFGMDREQRQKLKTLEKHLAEVGQQSAVQRWRATTLSLLAKRPSFHEQRALDTEAVVQEIYRTLSKLLPPPHELEQTVLTSLRKVMQTAVNLSIEMRTQRPEYVMLPPLQPEYGTNGDLVRKVHFNAALMNERSGETTSNEELEDQQAVVRIVLFPLVVKKGNDEGEGDEEIVVCPAQVLVARPGKDKKVVRVLSGDRMSVDQGTRSMQSIPSTNMDMGNVI